MGEYAFIILSKYVIIFPYYFNPFWNYVEDLTNFFFFFKEEILSMYYISYVVTILLGVQKTEKSNESGLTFSDIEI